MRLELNTSWIALTVGSALAFAPTAFAQTAQNERDTLVVTGTAVPVNADKVGQTITVISEQMIEDQGYVYVPEVLRHVPSVAVSQPGAPGSLTQVRIRGGEANHTLVLLDGIDRPPSGDGAICCSTLFVARKYSSDAVWSLPSSMDPRRKREVWSCLGTVLVKTWVSAKQRMRVPRARPCCCAPEK